MYKGIAYGGGIGAISEASDVDLSSPADGQILKYDATTQKWENDSLGDLASINKDGTSSTKYLRGDGTWQTFPTIPTVNNGQLTIQKNGSNVQTFTANQSSNATANIEVEEAVVESLSDSKPYLYRQSPAIGSRVMENALIGASVVRNQLIPITSASSSNVTNNGDGSFTVANGTTEYYILTNTLSIINGHKYLALSIGGKTSECYLRVDNAQGQPYMTGDKIFVATETASNKQAWIRAYNTTKQYKIIPMLIDLTQMFGTSIADAAYTKEQTTAGSGIAWLKSYGFFTKDYYAYNTGTLESVNPSAKKVVGFNQWDEEVETGNIDNSTGANSTASNRLRCKNYIPVLGGVAYYFDSENGKEIDLFAFDSDKNFIGVYYNGSFAVGSSYSSGVQGLSITLPQNCAFIKFKMTTSYGTTYNHDICINISKTTGTPKNGDYLPYESETYSISQSPLRGIPTLSNDAIVYDGDVRKSDGSTDRKFKEITFDNVTVSQNKIGTNAYEVYIRFSDKKAGYNNFVLPRFPYVGNSFTDVAEYSSRGYVTSGASAGDVAIKFPKSVVSTTTAAKQWLIDNGISIVYELATPTTEQLAPFDNPQISIVGGTEEWITSNDVPVGHDSEYKKLPAEWDDEYMMWLQEKAENAITECAYTSVVVNVPVSMSYTDKIVYVDFDVPTVQTYVGYTVDFSNCYVSLNAMNVALWWDDVSAFIDPEKLLGTIVSFWRNSNGVLKAQLEVRNIDLTSSDSDLAEAVLDLSFTIIGKPIITITS